MSGAVRVLCRCLCVREREREKSMERLEWEKMSCGSVCVCVPERNVLDRYTPQRINRRTWMNTNIKILHGLKVYIYMSSKWKIRFSLLKSVPSVSDLCLFRLFISLSSVDMYTTIHDSKHYIYCHTSVCCCVWTDANHRHRWRICQQFLSLSLSLQSPFPSTHTLTHKRTHTQVHVRDLTWPHDTTERKARGPWVAVSGHAPLHVPGCVSARAPWSKVWFWLSGPACWNVPWIFSAQDWFVLSEISYPFFPTLITVLLSSCSLFLGR